MPGPPNCDKSSHAHDSSGKDINDITLKDHFKMSLFSSHYPQKRHKPNSLENFVAYHWCIVWRSCDRASFGGNGNNKSSFSDGLQDLFGDCLKVDMVVIARHLNTITKTGIILPIIQEESMSKNTQIVQRSSLMEPVHKKNH